MNSCFSLLNPIGWKKLMTLPVWVILSELVCFDQPLQMLNKVPNEVLN
jgi:hypothetical protein